MKRVARKTVPNRSPQGSQNFLRRDSLFRTVVFATIIISLFPVLLYGAVSYYRSRAQLQSLVSNQLVNISSIGAKQVEDFVYSRRTALEKMVGERDFTTLISQISQTEQTNAAGQAAQDLLIQQLLSRPSGGIGERLFDYLIILDRTGKTAASSDDSWVHRIFYPPLPSAHPALAPWLSKGDTSVFLYNPFPPFEDQFALLTIRHFKTTEMDREYTLLAFSSAPLPVIVLTQAAGFFPGARAYFYLENADLLLSAADEKKLTSLPIEPAMMSAIAPAVNGTGAVQTLNYVSFNQTPVLSYVKKIPGMGLDLILEIPTQTLFGQIPIFDVYNLLMIAFAVIALTGLAYLGTTQVVNPLLQLNRIARGLADGNYSLRSKVDRHDEIGQLADSMNRLGVELFDLTTSMAGKVELRTEQLKTASEIASLAASFTTIDAVAEKTVNLINERFGFYHTAIYRVNETGTGIVLQDASGEPGIRRKQRARPIPFGENSVPGEVAQNNQACVITDMPGAAEDLPEARSQMVVPISTISKVLGVLEVFSTQPDAFNADTLFVVQTLANQIAAALQNAHLLLPDQIDFKETAFLYALTRQISEANDEKTITDLVLQALPLFPHTSAFLTFDQSNLRILGLYDPHTQKYEGLLSKIDIPTAHYYDEIAAGIPIFVQDVTQANNYDNILSFFFRRGCKSAVIMPSLLAGKVTKLLILGFHEDEYVHQDKLQPYFSLADLITNAFGRISALSLLRARLSELQILANFSKAASLETTVEQIYQTLHDQVIKILGADIAFLVATYNSKANQIEFPYACENNNPISLAPLPPGQGLISIVFEHKEPLLLVKDSESRAIELGARIIGKPARSWMGIPLILGSELVGVLVCQDPHHENRFNENHVSLFLALAPQVALSIRYLQLGRSEQDILRNYTQERLLTDTWLANTPDFVIVKNAHGQYMRASQATLDAFGLDPQHLSGKSDFDLLNPEVAAHSTEEELLILADGKPLFDIPEKTTINGQDTWFMASKIPITAQSGESSGLLSIRRDVTPLKRVEQESTRRAEEILISAEIAREATSRLDINEILEKTLQLISERFGFYHIAVYLIDALGEQAVLREATGEAGSQMKDSLYKLAVGSKSIVAQAAMKMEILSSSTLTADNSYERNPFLPESCAEIAFPLKIGDRILGVLDVHNTQEMSFSADDVAILGILADQLAIAVNNAELFALTQEMLGKHRLLHQITVAASTSPSLDDAMAEVTSSLVAAKEADRAAIFLLRQGRLEMHSSDGYPDGANTDSLRMAKILSEHAVQQHKAIRAKDARSANEGEITRSEIALPILFADEVLGVLNLESNQAGMFDENDQEIMSALVNNVGAVIANWRLVNQIRRQVDRQEALINATAKIRRSIDIPTILQTSVAEIGRAMGVSSARITLAEETAFTPEIQAPRLSSPTPRPGPNGKNGGHIEKEGEA